MIKAISADVLFYLKVAQSGHTEMTGMFFPEEHEVKCQKVSSSADPIMLSEEQHNLAKMST